MRIPKDVDIFGTVIPVEVTDLTADSVDGYYHYDTDLIQISNALTGVKRDIAFMHEFLHGVHDKASLRQSISEGVEQIIVDMTAKALMKNFILTPRKRKQKTGAPVKHKTKSK